MLLCIRFKRLTACGGPVLHQEVVAKPVQVFTLILSLHNRNCYHEKMFLYPICVPSVKRLHPQIFEKVLAQSVSYIQFYSIDFLCYSFSKRRTKKRSVAERNAEGREFVQNIRQFSSKCRQPSWRNQLLYTRLWLSLEAATSNGFHDLWFFHQDQRRMTQKIRNAKIMP